MSTEARKLLDLFRFKSPEEVEEMFRSEDEREEIEDEMADVQFFLLRLGQKYNIDLAGGFREENEKE